MPEKFAFLGFDCEEKGKAILRKVLVDKLLSKEEKDYICRTLEWREKQEKTELDFFATMKRLEK